MQISGHIAVMGLDLRKMKLRLASLKKSLIGPGWAIVSSTSAVT